ncbi:diguanylate cyclase (GGDEF)-like protein [Nakamurella sp. UYEF19]|uniref:putative bifunctional diguanylate cyclase/phosphodiesterase n=1 Tax=Nakamurella sp. UYEF19 TaxID=1756392 RepID=UPI003395465B
MTLTRYTAWKWVLGLGVCVIAAYFVVPGDAAKDLTYNAVGLFAAILIVVGVRLHRPSSAGGWYLVAGATGCFVLGDVVLNVYDLLDDAAPPSPSVADILYLAGYPLLFAGIFRVTRSSGSRGSRDSWTDAAAVCVGTIGLVWHFLMGPVLVDPVTGLRTTGFDLGKLVTMTYPVLDVGVLSVVSGTILWGRTRRTADQLLVVAVFAMLVADFSFDLLSIRGTFDAAGPVNIGFLLNYVLLAAAALHPSIGRVVDVPGTRARRRIYWLPLAAGIALLSPLILLLDGFSELPFDRPILSATSVIVFSLIALRVWRLFAQVRGQNELLHQQSESLRWALTAQRMLEDDLRHQASHDGLTGLANRGQLRERIDQALARAPSDRFVALCFCDLDEFKAINEGMGHEIGDDLLTVVAKRLNSIIRGTAIVARLGGDEFAVLLDDAERPEDAVAVAERIVSVVRQPFRLADRSITLSCSVGVAVAGPGTTTQALLSEADAAMYEAKSAGKDRMVFFEVAMRSRLLEKTALLNCFPGSLERSEFFLEYQPQFRLSDQALEGFEALIGWRHPTLGMIGPDRFIPLAEESRFILPLGRWILMAACREAAKWPSRAGRPLDVAVNLSSWQLQDPGFLDMVRGALRSSGLAARSLVLEITESVLMDDPAGIAELLREVRRLGVRVAIDDFGTGFSSLSYLRQLPVDILKIDKSFIDPLNDPESEGDAFVATIVRLATDLRLSTVAEGIEHPIQLDALVRLGCRSGQGYLVSPSLGPVAAQNFIEDHRNRNDRRPSVVELVRNV